ncbi:MAG: LysR family transcriptional regulator [Pseudomonadota bacterium]
MDISDIAMLEAIVKHGSINKASEFLHVTQPTLSKRLGRLEYKLGTPLFLRNSSGLIPTPRTQFILESSQTIKTRIKNIERHIELMNTLEAGDLHIGVGPIVEQLYFPDALYELTKSSTSKLNISIRIESGDDLSDLLVDGLIDLAIGPFEESESGEDYIAHPIACEPLVFAARYDHPLMALKRDGGDLSSEDVAQYPLIAPHVPQYMLRDGSSGDRPQSSRIICDNYSVIKDFLRESEHVSSGPGAVFYPEVEQGVLALLPMTNPIDWFASCIVRPESAELPIIRKVISIFRDYNLPAIDLS